MMIEFQSINFCNVMYKIIAKALSNRFYLALADVISKSQGAFISRRLISDNTIVFECLHGLKQKDGSMAIKRDMYKTYDCVERLHKANDD
ncbi:hypothetical protein Dsin_017241 [Dipteronia sinensis]|uniref:Reverse transcriptase n=1 Tax=Dipteronia sinensis TaxID=43782 RepID=A0AAE0AEM6_9ROSI|nr:hypothetical protein Dsin_017241 [Dipteronia sinensis]